MKIVLWILRILVVILVIALLVSIGVLFVEITVYESTRREALIICYQNGYPSVRELDGEYYCANELQVRHIDTVIADRCKGTEE